MILYYTGTGNSRYAAKLLGHRLNDTVRDCTPFMQGGTTPRFHSVTPWVFVCPTYAWQIPHIFADFLTRCHFSGSRQAYFVMTCGGEIHNAPETNRKLCTLWGCLEILSNVAPEAFSPLFHEPKIKNIAEYICNVHVEGPYYLNFGDCSPLAGRCGAREYRFGQAVGSDALQALAAADFRADADPDHLQNPDGSTHINLWYRLTTAFAEQELMECAAIPQHLPTVWYPSVGVYAARQGSWVLGAKFGSNGDSHNHNDTGSITVYKDGRPFLIDIGVESYTQKTFSPQRYEIWTMQSAWHNLPTFDGVQQLPGAEYTAREVCTDKNSITGELAGAYPPIPGLTTYHRSVSVSEQGVTLRDETDYPGTVELTLLTEQQPVPTADGFAVGILGGIRFDPGAVTAAVTAVPITDPRLRTAWPETLYKITLHFQKMLNLELY